MQSGRRRSGPAGEQRRTGRPRPAGAGRLASRPDQARRKCDARPPPGWSLLFRLLLNLSISSLCVHQSAAAAAAAPSAANASADGKRGQCRLRAPARCGALLICPGRSATADQTEEMSKGRCRSSLPAVASLFTLPASGWKTENCIQTAADAFSVLTIRGRSRRRAEAASQTDSGRLQNCLALTADFGAPSADCRL